MQIGGAWAVVCLLGGGVHADPWWLLGFAWHDFLGVGECPVDRWCASGMCELLALWGGCVCRSTALQIVDVAGPSVACLSESWVVILSMLLLLGQMWHARPCGIGIAYRSSMCLGHLWDACSGAGSVLRLTVLLGHLLCGCCVCGQWYAAYPALACALLLVCHAVACSGWPPECRGQDTCLWPANSAVICVSLLGTLCCAAPSHQDGLVCA